MSEALHQVSFQLNGEPVTVAVREDETLMETLRTRFSLRSVKNGCAPQGQCGACLALVDGAAKTTCSRPTRKTAGQRVTTLEGVPDEERERLARCFAAVGAVQCGFCLPAIALNTSAFVRRNPDPTYAEIEKHFNQNACRCTGYRKIFQGIHLFAAVSRGQAPVPEVSRSGRIGASFDHVDARAIALGEYPYVDDLRAPGLLAGALVLSPHARARVVRIDTRRAAELPGVAAVLTARDVPGERWTGLIERDWPIFVAEGEEVRYVGDVLAAVAAEDEHTARRAAALVEVEYEVLTPTLDPFEALEPGARQINPKHENALSRTKIVRGDVGAALAASAHVVEGRWRTQRIEQAFMEPESCMAVPEADGRLMVYSQGQGIFDDQRAISEVLDVPLERVHVALRSAGGAFGGKEDMSVQAQTALLAFETGRPVRITLSRDESIRVHPKRHPMTMDYRVGCDAEGHLTAVFARIVGDSGAYASVGAKVLERAAGHACGPYRVPVIDVESVAVYTNNVPCGAMRGFGVVQTAFAMEGALDRLAARVGIDRYAIRWRNALEVGDLYSTGQVLDKSVGLKKTLNAVKPFWDAAEQKKQAVGIACGLKNSGLGNGALEKVRVQVAVEAADKVVVYSCFSEMGQGLFTILAQCVIEETGLAPEVIEVRADTTYPLSSGQTTGSRGTLLAGRAAQDAARKLARDLERQPLSALVGKDYAGHVVIDDTTKPGAPGPVKTHTSFGYATQLVLLDEAGKLERVIAAHDVGRALNPSACVGQIQGAVAMGLGYALTESLDATDGHPDTTKLREIGLLRSRDVPPVDVFLIEEHEPEGPYGAKGVGEIGLVPTAAAVAGALQDFDGVARYVLPMRDSAAARGLSVGRKRKKKRDRGAATGATP